MQWEALYASRTSRMKASEIRELLKLLANPQIISFAGGIPDPTLFPTDKFQAALMETMSPENASDALQYSTSEGFMPLREQIAGYMQGKNIDCSTDNILITSGSQQGLDYLGKLFLSPKDTALVYWPSYLGALGAFNAYEPEYDRLTINENKPAQDYRDKALERGSTIKFAYMCPEFANPTGHTLNEQERNRILDLAQKLDIAVIEDAAYEALHYDGYAQPSILAMELERGVDINHARTVYCGTFSKTLAPGLRVGWICAAKSVVDKLVLIKQASDLHSPTLNQIAVSKVLESGFNAHLENLRTAYAAKRDLMLSTLIKHMPEGVEWTKPDGGMFVWVTLPQNLDANALLQYAVEKEKVAFVPGQAFHPDGSGKNTFRLSFSNATREDISQGIERLAKAIRHQSKIDKT